MKLDKNSAHHRVRKAIGRGYLVNREEKRGMPARIAIADPLPDEIEILPTTDALERCWSVGVQTEGVKKEDAEEDAESETGLPDPLLPPNPHSNTPTPPGPAPSDYEAVFEELAARAVPDPVDRRGCDWCGRMADHQPLRLVGDGERMAWLHRRCEAAWSNNPMRRGEVICDATNEIGCQVIMIFALPGMGLSQAPVTERPIALPSVNGKGSAAMPIGPFLNGENFDLETKRVLGVALELTCIALRVGDCDDDVKQAIANKVIARAKAGEHNPDVLCEQAVTDIRSPGM